MEALYAVYVKLVKDLKAATEKQTKTVIHCKLNEKTHTILCLGNQCKSRKMNVTVIFILFSIFLTTKIETVFDCRKVLSTKRNYGISDGHHEHLPRIDAATERGSNSFLWMHKCESLHCAGPIHMLFCLSRMRGFI